MDNKTTVFVSSNNPPTTVKLGDIDSLSYFVKESALYFADWCTFNKADNTLTCYDMRDHSKWEFSVNDKVIPVKSVNISYTV